MEKLEKEELIVKNVFEHFLGGYDYNSLCAKYHAFVISHFEDFILKCHDAFLELEEMKK